MAAVLQRMTLSPRFLAVCEADLGDCLRVFSNRLLQAACTILGTVSTVNACISSSIEEIVLRNEGKLVSQYNLIRSCFAASEEVWLADCHKKKYWGFSNTTNSDLSGKTNGCFRGEEKVACDLVKGLKHGLEKLSNADAGVSPKELRKLARKIGGERATNRPWPNASSSGSVFDPQKFVRQSVHTQFWKVLTKTKKAG